MQKVNDEQICDKSVTHETVDMTAKGNKLTTQMTECFIGPKVLANDDDDFDLDDLEDEMQQASAEFDGHMNQMVYSSQQFDKLIDYGCRYGPKSSSEDDEDSDDNESISFAEMMGIPRPVIF